MRKLKDLAAVREDVATHHSVWFDKVERMCDAVGIEPSLPRICGRQRHRSNVPADTPSEFYRRTISIDHLLSELDTRFAKHQQTALQGLWLIPTVIVTKKVEKIYNPKFIS